MQILLQFGMRFLSTPSARRATFPPTSVGLSRSNFYPRPPRGGRRGRSGNRAFAFTNFYPRPPRGGRLALADQTLTAVKFLSTPSARRATRATSRLAKAMRYFYPRPPRGGRRHWGLLQRKSRRFLSTPSARRATVARGKLRPASPISIHALREEGDNSFQCSQSNRLDFYPRPPRGGRRTVTPQSRDRWEFLSTPSARRATHRPVFPDGSRRISIHALREEGDLARCNLFLTLIEFLSTPSARRATQTQRLWPLM